MGPGWVLRGGDQQGLKHTRFKLPGSLVTGSYAKMCRQVWRYATKAVMRQKAETRRWRSGSLLTEWLHRKHSYLEAYKEHLLQVKTLRGKGQVLPHLRRISGIHSFSEGELGVFILQKSPVQDRASQFDRQLQTHSMRNAAKLPLASRS